MTITHITSLSQLDGLMKDSKKLTVIDFHATWCGPCHAIAPTFESLSKKHTNVNFAKCDVDAAQEVAQKYSVRAMPTFVFLKGSDVVDNVRGANTSALISTIEKHAGSGSSQKVFAGAGHKLGDSPTSGGRVRTGSIEMGSELKILAGLLVVWVTLMLYT